MTFMMRQVWIGTALGMAILGTSALASAQQTPERGTEPSGRGQGPEGKGLRESPGVRQQPGTDAPKTTDQPDKDRPKGAERPDKDRPRTTDRPDKERPKGAERPDKDRPRTTDQPDKERPKGAERPDKDGPRTTDRPDKERPKGAERPDRTQPGIAQPDGVEKGAPGRTRLSEQQRSEVGAKLRQTRIEKTRVQVNVSIGTRIPRSVRLHLLPSSILAVAPVYRGYSYFVREDDTIVIVDARTYVVIDVIPATTRTAGLSLSADQMRFIYARVPKDRTVDIRVRLALGAEVPRHVDLLAFPREVVARIPEVDDYRYVVVDRDVAIVDPRDNAIVLVISE